MINKTISVVTVHYNDFIGLSKTLESYKEIKELNKNIEFEWIIIDAKSDFKEYLELLNEIKQISDNFISEPDNGIYDGMNKGLKLTKNEWVIFMNAGDTFCIGNFFEIIFEKISSGSIVDVIYGASYEGTDVIGWSLKFSRSLNYLWWGMPTHHQAILFRTSIAKKYYYDLNYKIAADYKLVCQTSIENKKIYISDASFCFFDVTGTSSKNFQLGLIEQQQIRKEILKIPLFYNSIIYLLKKIMRYVRYSKISSKLYSLIRYKNETK